MTLEELNSLAEKIISSKSFGNSTTYANLLRYLVGRTFENDVPKETTIANEIFGKKDFDPSQSTLIRVYVYNLRKKLLTYYQNEGEKDKKCIKIPKGSYAVELIEKNEHIQNPSFSYRNLFFTAIGLLLVSLMLNLFSANSKEIKPLVDTNGLWKDLISSEHPKMLIMGDLFVYSETDTIKSKSRTVRDPSINSLKEFEKFKSANSHIDFEVEPLSYTHLILGSSQWVKKLSETFYSINENYSIRTMSRFNPKQLQDYDLLVVGMHKTLGMFKNFYDNSDFEYETESDAFRYIKNADKPIVYQPKGDADTYHTDYALMSKVPGPNNNNIYIFSGIWDTGATQSLKNFTNDQLRSEIEARMIIEFGELLKYYEVFFEVNGVDRMELRSKILYIKAL